MSVSLIIGGGIRAIFHELQATLCSEQDYKETLSGFQEQMSESPNVLDWYLTVQDAARR